MDYAQEVERLESNVSDFWSPDVGQHQVKGLSEMMITDPYIDPQTGDSNPKVKVEVEVAGDKKIWTMGIGKTLMSTYGQLCKLAKENNNSLKDLTFHVIVKSDGNKNDYTIIK